MTLFKDPNDYNYVLYGTIAILAVIASLFFREPATPQDAYSLHKHSRDGAVSNSLKPMVCDHPDVIINMMEILGEKPQMTMNNVSPNQDGGVIKTIIAFGLNSDTGTWSLVEFINPDWACIVGNGKDVTIIINKDGKINI